MTLDEMMSVVGYWHALIISRMEPLEQLVMFDYLTDKIDPKFMTCIQAHFLEITKE